MQFEWGFAAKVLIRKIWRASESRWSVSGSLIWKQIGAVSRHWWNCNMESEKLLKNTGQSVRDEQSDGSEIKDANWINSSAADPAETAVTITFLSPSKMKVLFCFISWILLQHLLAGGGRGAGNNYSSLIHN